MRRDGLEPPNSNEERFTVSCRCHLTIYAKYTVSVQTYGYRKTQLREWDSNPRPSAYETDNLTTDISRIQDAPHYPVNRGQSSGHINL